MNSTLKTVLDNTISDWSISAIENLTIILPIAFLVLVSIAIVYFSKNNFQKISRLQDNSQIRQQINKMELQTNIAIRRAEKEISKNPLRRG